MRSILSEDSKIRESLKKLIVVDVSTRHPSSGKSKDHLLELMQVMLDINEKKYLEKSDVIKHLRIVEPNENIVNFLILNLIKSNDCDGSFSFKNLALDHLKESWERLKVEWDRKQFAIPWRGETLFLKGEKSDYIKKEDESEMIQLFPNSKIKIIKNSGHWPHFDNQNDFINKLKLFL